MDYCANSSHAFTYANVSLLPNEQIGLHEQDTWELTYIVKGTGIRMIGGVSEAFESGEVVLVPPHVAHCWCFDPSQADRSGCIANVTVEFPAQLPEACVDLFPELTGRLCELLGRQEAVKFSGKRAEVLAALLHDMQGLDDAGRVPLFLQLLLLVADTSVGKVVGHCRKKDKRQELVSRIQTYVICNAHRAIGLSEVAKHVGMNRSAFCTFFRKAFAMTFVDYLNTYRVSQACRLLADRGMTIAEVGYRVGFNSVPYFNRVFKRVKGMSPGQYAVAVR